MPTDRRDRPFRPDHRGSQGSSFLPPRNDPHRRGANRRLPLEQEFSSAGERHGRELVETPLKPAGLPRPDLPARQPEWKTLRAKRGGGEIEEAFGFDLSPLVARAAEFKRLATEAIAAERQLHALRDRITISRRDIDKMIATGLYEGEPADWRAFSEAFEGLNRRVPRRANLEMLMPMADALDRLHATSAWPMP